MKKISAFISTLTLYLSSALSAHAQGSFPINLESQVEDRVAIKDDLGSFITHGFSAIIIVAAIASFLYMVYGGVQWVSSGGEKDKLNEAKGKITQAIVGLAIVASAWAVFKLIDYFFGIGITE